MKIYHDIEQGTEEWFKIKWGKVGGSASKGLFVPSDTLMLEVLAELTEPFEMYEDGYVSKEMQRGIELEPMARESLSEYCGVKFLTPGWIESGFSPMIGISPDGINEDATVSCEIKCPGAKKHIATVLAKDIPADNIHQCLHYFTTITTLETHYFYSFRPESNFPAFPKKITRDSIIDLGTKAKPNCKKVSEWVDIAKGNALLLETNLKTALANLAGI